MRKGMWRLCNGRRDDIRQTALLWWHFLLILRYGQNPHSVSCAQSQFGCSYSSVFHKGNLISKVNYEIIIRVFVQVWIVIFVVFIIVGGFMRYLSRNKDVSSLILIVGLITVQSTFSTNRLGATKTERQLHKHQNLHAEDKSGWMNAFGCPGSCVDCRSVLKF